MERDLDAQLEKVFAAGAIGVIAANQQGLALGVKGPVDASVAGYVSLLSDRAKDLSDSSESPIVVIEADSYNVLITRKDEVTTAVFKTAA